jgi:AraC family transcriptional regulator
MARRLGLGQYCGRSVRQRQVHGFVITENWFVPGLQIDRHAHQHTHFTFILEGSFTESYDRMVLECVPGAALFVPANEPHTDRICPDGAHTIGVELSPGVAERVMSQTGVLKDARLIESPQLEQSGRRLYREFRSGDSASALSMEAIALEMLVQTARIRTTGERGEPAWMKTVRDHLHESYSEPISLAELGKLANVHETHLARAFRKRHGCTVGEYVRRLRVDASALELKGSDKPVALIAAEAGFYDQAHFCRSFRRAYGGDPQ